MEHKITVVGGVLGWIVGLITGNAIIAISLAFATGAAAYMGQQFGRWMLAFLKQKYKSITIKFKK